MASLCDTSSLQTQADVELARRGPAGIIIFAGLIPVLLFSTSFFRSHLEALFFAVLVSYSSVSVRLWLVLRGGKLYGSRRRLWVALCS